ncbi:hypothetical protein BKA67DRAFT_581851 [Truncatella angustata]|uniref:Uncharacterized protein n=1 Tax=Truncatella angustata TaxID=152316 RepID=A0A9P8RPA7_9PEZI|nr:uncharacterized protein BKA67DRAFT_581851 [Truncatella angustata]KAH6647160.1 hypothetical protein BKA67DRAFT_581851 [Truncatella angustata]
MEFGYKRTMKLSRSRQLNLSGDLNVRRLKVVLTQRWVRLIHAASTSQVSAELSEAINSMFKRYREAVIYWAFLEDVHTTRQPAAPGLAELNNTTWVTRRRTPQEVPSIGLVGAERGFWRLKRGAPVPD